jgi:hypothetical protein
MSMLHFRLFGEVSIHLSIHQRERPEPGLSAKALELLSYLLLYRGDLIEAWYQDWCIYERDRLQLTFLAMLEKLTADCEAPASTRRSARRCSTCVSASARSPQPTTSGWRCTAGPKARPPSSTR